MDGTGFRYEKKVTALNELETARYRLDEFLSDLNVSMLRRMKKAYLQCGCTSCDEYRQLVAEIWSDTESQMRPYLLEIREHFGRTRSVLKGILGGVTAVAAGAAAGVRSVAEGVIGGVLGGKC